MNPNNNKVLRGNLLGFLNNIYPDGAVELTIIGVFYQYHRDKDIRRELEFLADKKYISLKIIDNPIKRGSKEKFFKITPEGIEILEGTRKDDSIILAADHQEEN